MQNILFLNLYVFSVFGIFDPPLLDSVLYPVLKKPMGRWNYDFLLDVFNNNIFIAWSAAGAIEMSLIVTLIAIPIAGLAQLIKKD